MLKILLLGAIQGLTEFFPVSSTGHLIIAQHFLGINKNIIFLDTFLHMGTILALISFFYKDIIAAFKNGRMIALIALVTIVTGSLGLAFKKQFEASFDSLFLTAACFIINGIILILTKFFREKEKKIGFFDAGLMGVAQAVAILPSISRSGLTIATLMGLGIKKEEAFKFSFIASIPAIIGAFLLETKDLPRAIPYSFSQLALGICVSFAFGLLSLFLLNKIIGKNKFYAFGYYCVVLGIGLLFVHK